MAEQEPRLLEVRLHRVENLLVELLDLLGTALGGFRRPHGDPPAEDLARRRPHGDPPAADLARRPIADPAAPDFVRQRLSEIMQARPGWFTDPPPEDFLNVRILDLIRRFRGGFTDPAPSELADVRLRDLLSRVPGGGFTDPGPDDIKRLSTVELETTVHRINAEMLRLKSLQGVLEQRLTDLRK
jgi:hypothetical protein